MTAETNNQPKPKVKEPQKPPPVAETEAPGYGSYAVGRATAGAGASPTPPHQIRLNPAASVFTSVVMRQMASGVPLEMPGHKTARGLRETAVLQMQKQQGNTTAQRFLINAARCSDHSNTVVVSSTHEELSQRDIIDDQLHDVLSAHQSSSLTEQSTNNAHASLQQQYNVTGPTPHIPDNTHLRRMSLQDLKAIAVRLSNNYGSQNAPALLRIYQAARRHTSISSGEADIFDPLDPLWAYLDIWEIDRVRYSEYLRLIQPRGVVTMGEGVRIPRPTPEQNQPADHDNRGNHSNNNDGTQNLPPADSGHGTRQTIGQVLDGADSLIEAATTAAEIAEMAGQTLPHALEGATFALGVLGAIIAGAAFAFQVIEAADNDQKITQLMGFVYGFMYEVDRRQGPTQLPASVYQRRSQAERMARFSAGVRQGRDLAQQRSGSQNHTRSSLVRAYIIANGVSEVQSRAEQVLNRIWQQTAGQHSNQLGTLPQGYILGWPEVNVTGFR